MGCAVFGQRYRTAIDVNATVFHFLAARRMEMSVEKEISFLQERGHVRVEYINYEDFTYKIVDVTKAARLMERTAEKEIFALGKLKRKDALCPCIPIGEHCETPYRCWYYDFCRKKQF